MFYKNDIIQIYVKSKYINKNSIKINLYGYHKTILNLIGDTNFFTDTPIYFNNNTTPMLIYIFIIILILIIL